jgi:hypothetical protein
VSRREWGLWRDKQQTCPAELSQPTPDHGSGRLFDSLPPEWMAIVFVNLYERARQLSSDTSKKTAGDREPLLSPAIEDASQRRSQNRENSRLDGRLERIHPLNAAKVVRLRS